MKRKSVLLLVIALIMALSLSACGDKQKAAEEEVSGTDMLKTALTNMNNAKSMVYDMDMNMSMSAEGQTLNISTTGKIEYLMDPITMKMAMTMDMGDGNPITTTSYAETVDGQLVMYTETGDGAWYKQTLGDAAALQQYSATESINAYVSDPSQFKEVGTEDINGSEAVKFEGTLTEESLNEALNASGVLSQMNLDGMDEATLKSLYQGIGDMPMTIWIDKKTVLPVKYEMDLAAMMKAVMENVMAAQASEDTADVDITFDKMVMTMTVSGYDTITSIEIPAETQNAQEMTDAAATAE